MTLDGVEVREIPGFEGLLAVAADGRFCTLRGRVRWIGGEVLPAGYIRIGTVVDGRSKKILAHRAVKMTWDPRADAGSLDVHHRDFNRTNNALENLQWVTTLENNTYSREAGRHSIAEEKNPKSKLTASMVRAIRRRYGEGATIAQLVKEFPVNWCSVWRVVTLRSWKDVK